MTTSVINSKKDERVLRRPEVQEKLGLKKSTFQRLQDSGEFPPPIELSVRTRGWLESEIDAWLEQRVKKRDAKVQAAQTPPPRVEAKPKPKVVEVTAKRRPGRPRKVQKRGPGRPRKVQAEAEVL